MMMVLILLLFTLLAAQEAPTDSLPPLKPDADTTATLPAGGPFFEYRYELDELRDEIDSLKQVLKVYEKRKSIPQIDPALLEFIRTPELKHRITLQNGTVIIGEILLDEGERLIVRTPLGELVIDRKHVAKIEDNEALSPKIEWIREPTVKAYPNKEIIRGVVRNTGQIRADFVRVIAHLWTQTTEEVARDSAFVAGKQVTYKSGVISDTAIEPGQTVNVVITVAVPDDERVAYRTYDFRWIEAR
ncbi:MAG: hypothetical protein ACE5D8_07690 [Fidelibacterota bacterium]